jgi:hypothetical protein
MNKLTPISLTLLAQTMRKVTAFYSLVWIVSLVYAMTLSTPAAESYWLNPLAIIGLLSSTSFLIYSWVKHKELASLLSCRWEDKAMLLVVVWLSVEAVFMLSGAWG